MSLEYHSKYINLTNHLSLEPWYLYFETMVSVFIRFLLVVFVARNISKDNRTKDTIKQIIQATNSMDMKLSKENWLMPPINRAATTMQTINPASVQKNIEMYIKRILKMDCFRFISITALSWPSVISIYLCKNRSLSIILPNRPERTFKSAPTPANRKTGLTAACIIWEIVWYSDIE